MDKYYRRLKRLWEKHLNDVGIKGMNAYPEISVYDNPYDEDSPEWLVWDESWTCAMKTDHECD